MTRESNRSYNRNKSLKTLKSTAVTTNQMNFRFSSARVGTF